MKEGGVIARIIWAVADTTGEDLTRPCADGHTGLENTTELQFALCI